MREVEGTAGPDFGTAWPYGSCKKVTTIKDFMGQHIVCGFPIDDEGSCSWSRNHLLVEGDPALGPITEAEWKEANAQA